MAINFSGYVFNDEGTAVSGATVLLQQVCDGATEASTTTNSAGKWSFSESDQDTYNVKVTVDPSVRYRNWDDAISIKEIDLRNNTGNTTPALTATNLTNNAANIVGKFGGANTTRADNDEIYFTFELANSAGELTEYGRMTVVATDVTDGEEDGQFEFDVMKSGTLTKAFTIASSTSGAQSIDFNQDAITFGTGADTDISLTFDANSNDGVITWMEDEDHFKFSDEIFMNSTEKIEFGDTGTFIHQSSDGVLTITSDTTVDINGAVVLDGTVTVGVDDTGHDVKFFGASAGAYMEWDESADQLRIMGASADATTSTGKLLLATSLTDINANDVIGKIDFQAPHEAGGTDAITVAASIQAIAQGTFSASVNATDLIFYTGHSEAATEKFRFTSQGEIGVGGANYGSSGDVLTSGGAGAAPSWQTPTTGDITGVTAGVGLSGGGSSGGVTLTLDLSELSTVTPADGDSFSTLDSDGSTEQKTTTTALATLFAGTGLTASSSVIGVDASQAITALTGGDLTIYEDANDADVSLKMGTSATESLTVAVLNGGSNKTAEEVHFSTATASGTADHGKMVFDIDGTDILTIDDGGLVILTTGTIGPVGDEDLITLTASGNIVTVAGEISVTTLDIGGTDVSSTAAELNYNDTGAAVGTVVASKTVTADSNKDVASFRNVTLTGTLVAADLDISSDVDVDGTLETDALTIGGAAVLAQATASAVGAVELATSAEINTSTDASRVITPDAFAASNYGIRYVQVVVLAAATALTTGDGKAHVHIPAGLNGMDLVEVHAEVQTVGTGSTIDIQIHNATDGADMLSTKLTIDASESGSDSAAAAAVINTSNDDVATNDVLRIDIDQIGSSDPGNGLIVTMGFRIP